MPGIVGRADIDLPGFFDMLLLAVVAKARWPGTTDERAARWAVSFCRYYEARQEVIEEQLSIANAPRWQEPLSMCFARKAFFRYADYLNTPLPSSLLENRP
jgi:hypothetical protein